MNAITQFDGKNRYLSNFFSCPVPYEGLIFPSSEHAFVAAKTVDPETRLRIVVCPSPGEVKKLGLAIPLRPDWEQIKLQEMEKIVRIKFTHNRILGIQLRLTGDAELVEGNWWGDKFWGVYEGVGENHLGKILMKIRSELCHVAR